MKITDLCISYDSHKILENLSLELKEGDCYALMGPSGRGKTTLLHILLGILSPDSGSLQGFEHKRFSAVFQENRLFEFLTAAENIALVSKRIPAASKTGPRDPNKISELNDILKTILPEESLSQPVREYSGGMKRRTAIARSVLAQSDILVMDEPFTGLDEDTREQVIRFILKYQEGRTLIFSTHDSQDVESLGAHLITLPGL